MPRAHCTSVGDRGVAGRFRRAPRLVTRLIDAELSIALKDAVREPVEPEGNA
jgi:hypothetical protein